MTKKISHITLEDVARYPLPGMAVPGNLAFSPDDQEATYLFSSDGSLMQNLYAFDIQSSQHRLIVEPPGGGTTEDSVSLEEALRRERMRQRELGITTYAWSKKQGFILVPINGSIYLSDEPQRPLRILVNSVGKPAIDPRISPSGEMVAYVCENELYVILSTGGEPFQVTHGARGTGKTHGLAEYIAQEEMNRSRGYWWSPDSRYLAFTEVDETHIPVYPIVYQGKDDAGKNAQEEHRYPFAGKENARIQLGVVSVQGGAPVWMDLGDDPDIYLARVKWLPDGRLSAQILNRSQTEITIYLFNPLNGTRSLLLREHSEVWINLHDMFRPLAQDYKGHYGCFIWASERSGFRHLYLYNGDGSLVHQLTSGDWMVDSLVGVDEKKGIVYFTASCETPTESHLYAIPLSGGEMHRLTHEPGMHTVVLDHACQRFLDIYQSIDQPPSITLRSLETGSPLAALFDERDSRIDMLGLRPPELVNLQNRVGIELHGALFKPPKTFGAGPHPTIVFVYGGPHAQLVTNSWVLTVAMRVQHLRNMGFLVFVLDNRGSARRGLAFEGAVKHDLGHLEVEDQVDGVRWLVDQGLTDPQRVGIYGWSYGGYMSAMCLARAPETFIVAVAGAPVTHWDGYDTNYTERYMGTPKNNPAGYQESSVMQYTENFNGKLMLIHGLIDENVHFRHTARLINSLISARKDYDLLLFPDERHMPRKLEDRVYMEQRICEYFLKHLGQP